MSITQSAIDKAIAIANDDTYGYDQTSRWGPNYDCSSFVISVWESVGVKVKSGGATYTGNMKRVFLKNGFSDVTGSVNLVNASGMLPGDVLLNESSHAAMYVGNGNIVQASLNEKGGTTGGQSGDQTGKEIRVRSYYNFPWNCVLRYQEANGSTVAAKGSTASYSPIVCMMTQSTCYKQTRKMNIKGVLWHSTGVNNPWLRRYVQPDDNAANKADLLNKIGSNPYHNDWNHTNVQAGVNAWIGKLNDGTIATVQTLPWDFRPWGCGSGSKGSCNDGWLQFEIAEDGLSDKSYFNAVYAEACKLTAYLCRKFNIDPHGAVNGIPTILCHQDSYKYGMGSNHADVYHWFNRYGKTMENVRNDVAALLGGSSIRPQTNTSDRRDLGRGDSGADVKELQENLIKLGYSLPKYGADGDFGAETVNAVKELQRKYRLTADGVVGEKTFALIDKLLNETTPSTIGAQSSALGVGDVVMFTGSSHYFSANAVAPKACKPGKAKITRTYQIGKAKHPFHIVAMPGGGSNVNGWVDADSIKKV